MKEQVPVGLELSDAVAIAENIIKEFGWTPEEGELVSRLSTACPPFEHEGSPHVWCDDLENFISNLNKALLEHDSGMLFKKRGLAVDRVADVQEFCESSEFFNQKGHVRPLVMEALWELFHGELPRVECVLSGGVGWGKSFCSEMATGYMIYLLSCYHNPQIEFDLAPGSSIIFIHQSKTEKLAKKVLFEQFAERVRLSPYFKKYFQFDPNIKSELRFPKQLTVLPIGGSDTSALGLNVYGGCFPGNQMFAVGPGELCRLNGDLENNLLTINESNCIINSRNKPRTVRTGFKSLVRLYFVDGTSIVCTKDQRFKSEDGTWLRAEDCERKRLRFADLSSMRSKSYVFDTTPQAGASYDRKAVQRNVSNGTLVRGKADSTAARQEGKGRICDVPSLWGEIQVNYSHSSCFSWDGNARIQREIPKGFVADERSIGGQTSESKGARVAAAPRSEVQRSNQKRGSESSTPWARKDKTVGKRSSVDQKKVGRGEKEVCGLFSGKEKIDSGTWSCRKETGTSRKEKYDSLYKQRGKGSSYVLQVGSGSSIPTGFEEGSLGVRDSNDKVPWSDGGGEILCTGFQCGESVGRGEGTNCCGTGPLLGVQAKGSSRTYSNNGQRFAEAWRNARVQLVEQEQDQKNIVQRIGSKIPTLACIRVEHLNFFAPVYDIEHVQDTHAFLPWLAEERFLIAHNCIDEMNFMARVQDSVETRFTGEAEYDQAEKLYSTIVRRMKSRFMQKGTIPGKLMLISSVHYPGDFTSRKEEEAKTDKTILFRSHSQWEALPSSAFSSNEKFLVEIGNELKQSRIVRSREEATDPEDVIEVPVDYRSDFNRDIDAALRDIAGVATGTKHPFIPYRELIQKAQEEHQKVTGGRQLFKMQEVVINNYAGSDLDLIVDLQYIEEVLIDPFQVCVAHLDVGLSSDAAGLAVGRVAGYKILPVAKFFDERRGSFVEVRDIRAPIYMIDGVLRIVAPPGGEVDLELVRDLIMYLRGVMALKWCTMDSYQAPMFYQAFRKVGIRSGVLSVDETIAPYTELKMAVKDERVWLPPHEVMAKEIREVEKIPDKDKVDHPPNGSKDCADGVAGVCFVLHKKVAKYGRAGVARSAGSKKEDVREGPARVVRFGGGVGRRGRVGRLL